MAPLPFTAARVAVGLKNSAAAVLDPSGGLIIFPDVNGLTSNPGGASGMRVHLMGTQRTMAFAPDGQSIYVLGGSNNDPCANGPLAKNGITVVGLDGGLLGNWMLPGFVSDIAVDPTTFKIVITDTSNNQIDAFDATTPFGAVNPQKLSTAKCPSAVRVVGGQAFVVTGDSMMDMGPLATTLQYVLQRINIVNGQTTKVPFTAPAYVEDVTGAPPPDMNTSFDFKLLPASFYADELAVTPDGSRAVFSTRSRYHETMSQSFMLLGSSCAPNLDIVEYGLYTMDTVAGTTQYTSRSTIVITPADPVNMPCVTCQPMGLIQLEIFCAPATGDQAAGLSAVFGGT
jgi:hypothetical protein